MRHCKTASSKDLKKTPSRSFLPADKTGADGTSIASFEHRFYRRAVICRFKIIKNRLQYIQYSYKIVSVRKNGRSY